MARRRQGGRTTTKPPGARRGSGSGRYTPPTPKEKKRSPLWVPVAMFTLLLCGVVVIVANYLGVLPGGEAQNSDLILGLVLMVAGFIMATQYR